jgi:short-subunit dehydrogenase
VRNLEKGEAAKRSIEGTTGRKGAVEVAMTSAATSPSSSLSESRRSEEIDVVVENAGIATNRYVMAEDNESTITVNVVSTFLLGLMILPKLRETATKYNSTRIWSSSSEVHAFTSFPEKSGPEHPQDTE